MAQTLSDLVAQKKPSGIAPTLRDFGRGYNREAVAGLLGAPVDMATTLANLLMAGGGYLGHKAGLLDQPPDLIQNNRAVGSSDWIYDRLPHQPVLSNSPAEQAGRLAGALMSPPAVLKAAPTTIRALSDALQEKAPSVIDKYMDAMGAKQNVFAGERAATADAGALERAKALDAQGMSRRKIHQQTGWSKGADDKWRFQIDDKQAKLRTEDSGEFTLNDLLDHPKLFEAYPDLKNVKTSIVSSEMHPLGPAALYDPQFDAITVANQKDTNNLGSLSSLLHEIQHAIQKREGFARGASVNTPRYDDYYGEIEARHVQKLLEGLALPPYVMPTGREIIDLNWQK